MNLSISHSLNCACGGGELRSALLILDRVALQPKSSLKPIKSRPVVRELIIIGEMNLDKFGDEAAGQNGCRLVLLSEQHRQRGMSYQ